MRVRKNVYNLPPDDQTLNWYNKAVLKMKERPATDPTSWYYQGAIHGFNAGLPYWANVGTLPSKEDQYEFWKQCQHGSWYFLPWHRMYLAYFEQIVRQAVVELGGPEDWALPFWNYSDKANPNALVMPAPFTSPADSSNGLWMEGRESDTLQERYVNLDALKTIPFTGDGITSELGFGGPETVFSHSGRTHGQLEHIPHDMVHVMIGGAMGDPRAAALDPIFWLHHANIDRLWQVWLNQGNRYDPVKSSWTDFSFKFHDANGNAAELTCREVEDTRDILDGYTYEGVNPEPPVALESVAASDLDMLQVPLEVVGASNERKMLSSNANKVQLDMVPSRRKSSRFIKMATESTPEKTFLHFENVTGKGTPPIYDVYVHADEQTENDESHYAGSLAFFGIEEASTANEHHAGNGQHFALEISDLFRQLKEKEGWSEDKLHVTIKPSKEPDGSSELSVGRISVYTT